LPDVLSVGSGVLGEVLQAYLTWRSSVSSCRDSWWSLLVTGRALHNCISLVFFSISCQSATNRSHERIDWKPHSQMVSIWNEGGDIL